jgi:hypothetical protein
VGLGDVGREIENDNRKYTEPRETMKIEETMIQRSRKKVANCPVVK